ncbi:MAG: glycosyltransferase, partial [Haliea sp.]
MGGYEGADHVNSRGTPLHLNDWNGHWPQLAQDYRQLAGTGIRAVRESIGWRALTGPGGQADLDRLRIQAELAASHGLQVIWTIHHYGLPDGVDFFAPDFAERFADFCFKVSRTLTAVDDGPGFYQPVNEISFLTWAVTCSTLIHPYDGSAPERGYELKCRLVEAALRGCDAIWANDAGARMVHTDPVIHVVAAADASPEAAAEVEAVRLRQYQAWDMLCGRLEPSLGGAPHYLDILGANYYHDNQWEHPSQQRLHWHLGDARRCGLDDMLGEVWARYQRPLFLAETGHVGHGRANWLDDVAGAALRCLEAGVPLEGICVYPLLDRADWEEPARWHRSGLWDVRPQPGPADAAPAFSRVLHEPFFQRIQHWQALLPPGASAAPFFCRQPGASMSPLIVFSHLRWDFVYQRPQQLLSRLAAQRPVIFVEEPMPGAARPTLERLQPCKGVEVLRCHVTGASHGFADEHLPAMRALLAQYLAQQGIEAYWLWFYTPMALPLADGLAPAGVVYDCMDELSAFRHAPPELLLREEELFKRADLVFTGGHSLYDAKRQRHPQVSCFPSSVDAAHYARPSAAAGILPANDPLQGHLPRPRLGYCGVIDERIDLPLVAAIADAHPEWQVVMVGPVVKIDPASLPQRANIHWLGQQDYADLPPIIHAWDVCLMPFALNESTRFISPTKTLEYLAAGCPVVSTPIHDVVTGYPGIVAIADSAERFVAACAAALDRSDADKAAEAEAVQHLLER